VHTQVNFMCKLYCSRNNPITSGS